MELAIETNGLSETHRPTQAVDSVASFGDFSFSLIAIVSPADGY